MKIAVCFSSQLRNYKLCLPRLRKKFTELLVNQGHTVDYFGSFSNNLSFGFKYYNRKFGIPKTGSFTEVNNGLLTVYNDWNFLIDKKEAYSFLMNHIQFKKLEILDNWNDPVKTSYTDGIYDREAVSEDGLSINQWYYAERSVGLMQEYEKETNQEYDVIIRMRPDMLLMYIDLLGITNTINEPYHFKAGYVEVINGWPSIGDWNHIFGKQAAKRYHNGLCQRLISGYNDMWLGKNDLKQSWGGNPPPETMWAYCTRGIGKCTLTTLGLGAMLCRQFIDKYYPDIDSITMEQLCDYQFDISLSNFAIEEYLNKITNYNVIDDHYDQLRNYIDSNNINSLKLRENHFRDDHYLKTEESDTFNILKDFKL